MEHKENPISQEIADSLRRFHESEPILPADPEEQSRRLALTQTDPVYLNLRDQYEAATGQTRLDIGLQMRTRRWNILTSSNPEQLIAQAQEGQNQ